MTNSEIKTIISHSLRTAYRQGYRIDDEARSLLGYTIVVAIKHWTPEREASFESYVMTLFLRSLGRLKKWLLLPIDANEFFIERRLRTYVGQQALLSVPEPEQTVCFAVWIERLTRKEVSEQTGLTLNRIENILIAISRTIRRAVDDSARI